MMKKRYNHLKQRKPSKVKERVSLQLDPAKGNPRSKLPQKKTHTVTVTVPVKKTG